MDGSYINGSKGKSFNKPSSNNETITQQELTPRAKNNIYAGVNTKNLIG